MIEDLNTAYPVRTLAERPSSIAYFLLREFVGSGETLYRSRSHEYNGTWRPEEGSHAANEEVRHKSYHKPKYHWEGSDCVRVGWPKWGWGAREMVRDTQGFSKCLTGEVCLSCSWQYEQHLERVADASALAAKLNRK